MPGRNYAVQSTAGDKLLVAYQRDIGLVGISFRHAGAVVGVQGLFDRDQIKELHDHLDGLLRMMPQ